MLCIDHHNFPQLKSHPSRSFEVAQHHFFHFTGDMKWKNGNFFSTLDFKGSRKKREKKKGNIKRPFISNTCFSGLWPSICAAGEKDIFPRCCF